MNCVCCLLRLSVQSFSTSDNRGRGVWRKVERGERGGSWQLAGRAPDVARFSRVLSIFIGLLICYSMSSLFDIVHGATFDMTWRFRNTLCRMPIILVVKIRGVLQFCKKKKAKKVIGSFGQ